MVLICSQHTSLCSQTHYIAWWDSSVHSTHLSAFRHTAQHDGTHLLTAHISLHSQAHYIAWRDSSVHGTHLSAQSNKLHSMMGLICSQYTFLCIVKNITYIDGTHLLTAHISLQSQTHYIAWWDSSAHSTHLSAQSNTLHSMMRLICSQHTFLCIVKHIT